MTKVTDPVCQKQITSERMSIKRTPVSKLLINQRGDWARDITNKKWIIFITTSNLAQDLNRTFAVASIHQRYYDTITAIKATARRAGVRETERRT